MKKFLIFAIVAAVLVVFMVLALKWLTPWGGSDQGSLDCPIFVDQDGVGYKTKVNEKNLLIFDGTEWNPTFIKGVNIGAAKPGYFPGEFGITKADYLRWFQYISDMNANSIRIYTIHQPVFYEALLEYNQQADEPLYLFHGVWINEADIVKYHDAYHPRLYEDYKLEITRVIDVLHGNAEIEPSFGNASGSYASDVSPYLAGIILGLEWDPEFVVTTNENHQEKVGFQGEYLFAENASPFENFLCETADFFISYQMENYQTQVPMSFTNWVTTDMLEHPNEPFIHDDIVAVNTEHIKAKKSFKCGLFASYHIYPYYPETMNVQKEYVTFRDDDGKINPYKAYLRDLRKEHTVPVIVAEFGIPSGRGKAHDNIHSGFNQGNVTEQEQGAMVASMLEDIFQEGYAGGLIFSFQDEWFKRTWNTMELDDPQRRPYWDNLQTNEQHFGVLAFDPGAESSVCYIDGNYDEWGITDQILKKRGVKIYAKYDASGLYLYVEDPEFKFDSDTMLLPINVRSKQGNHVYQGIEFKHAADFMLVVDGTDATRLLIDPTYDSFQYLYGVKSKLIPLHPQHFVKNSGQFVPIFLPLSKGYVTPEDGVTHPFVKYETGLLRYGRNNPLEGEFDSLVDFYAEDGHVEVRIPWQLLNFMDPSRKIVMGDFNQTGIRPIKQKKIHIGIIKDQQAYFAPFTWEDWEMPLYHERLKQSYYILSEAFAKY